MGTHTIADMEKKLRAIIDREQGTRGPPTLRRLAKLIHLSPRQVWAICEDLGFYVTDSDPAVNEPGSHVVKLYNVPRKHVGDYTVRRGHVA